MGYTLGCLGWEIATAARSAIYDTMAAKRGWAEDFRRSMIGRVPARSL